MTHYIPAFTTRIRQSQQAACGEYVRQDEHSTEPSCQACKSYLDWLNRPVSVEELFGPPEPPCK